jgi:hypothetical protein
MVFRVLTALVLSFGALISSSSAAEGDDGMGSWSTTIDSVDGSGKTLYELALVRSNGRILGSWRIEPSNGHESSGCFRGVETQHGVVADQCLLDGSHDAPNAKNVCPAFTKSTVRLVQQGTSLVWQVRRSRRMDWSTFQTLTRDITPSAIVYIPCEAEGVPKGAS